MDKKKLESALKRKGFSEDTDSDHRWYHFHYKGRDTGIKTKTSHGSSKYKVLSAPLQKKVKDQLKLDTSKQLKDLIDCPFTEKDYINHLIQKNLLE